MEKEDTQTTVKSRKYLPKEEVLEDELLAEWMIL